MSRVRPGPGGTGGKRLLTIITVGLLLASACGGSTTTNGSAQAAEPTTTDAPEDTAEVQVPTPTATAPPPEPTPAPAPPSISTVLSSGTDDFVTNLRQITTNVLADNGNANITAGNLDTAIKYLQKAIELAEEMDAMTEHRGGTPAGPLAGARQFLTFGNPTGHRQDQRHRHIRGVFG